MSRQYSIELGSTLYQRIMQPFLRNTRVFHSYAYVCVFVARLRRIEIQPGYYIVYSSADREYNSKLLIPKEQLYTPHNYSLTSTLALYKNIPDIIFCKGVVNKYSGEGWFEMFHDGKNVMIPL